MSNPNNRLDLIVVRYGERNEMILVALRAPSIIDPATALWKAHFVAVEEHKCILEEGRCRKPLPSSVEDAEVAKTVTLCSAEGHWVTAELRVKAPAGTPEGDDAAIKYMAGVMAELLGLSTARFFPSGSATSEVVRSQAIPEK